MPLEYELKYLKPDFEALRNHLKAANAEQTAAPYFEENMVFDYLDRSLKAEGVLLRLRRKAFRDAVLTVKRPSSADVASDLKVYEETETQASDFDATRMVLESLGYSVAFKYEKVREKWLLGEVVICMDRMPFGDFVELEGPEAAVPEAAKVLGLDKSATSKATYHELNRACRAENGQDKDENFVFSAKQREEVLLTLKS